MHATITSKGQVTVPRAIRDGLHLKPGERSPGHVSLVLVELVWVLTRAYGYGRADVAGVVLQVLRTTEFDIEDTDGVWAALREFEVGTANFADYVIARRNRDAGCGRTYTFDRKAATGRHFAKVP